MARIRKLFIGLLAVAFLLTASLGIALFNRKAAFADGEKTVATHTDYYYGSKLENPLAIAFYDALCQMDFTSGENMQLTDDNIIFAAQQLATGDKEILKQFGAARDCFYYDRADLFYVDIDQLSLNVACKGGNYVVDMGAGRSDGYFVKGVTAGAIPSMAEEYEGKLAAAVQAVRDDLAERNLTEDSVEGQTWTYWNAYCANSYVVDNVSYGFCQDAYGRDTVDSALIRTSYGAAVNGEVVCEGYARFFKAIMNGLGFKCELIYGAAVNGAGGVEPHMWTAVYDETKEVWCGVDPTWNDTDGYLAGNYIMISGTVMGIDHFPDPIISSSTYELEYPELYEETIEMPSGLFETFYEKRGNDNIFICMRYDGMNYTELKKQNRYIAVRVNYGEAGWGPWSSYDGIKNQGITSYFMDDKNYTDGYSRIWANSNGKVQHFEIAIVNGPDNVRSTLNNKPINYSEDYIRENLIEKSNEIANSNYDPAYVAPAYVKSITATTQDGRTITNWQTSKQDIALGKMHIKVVYSQNLLKIDANGQPSISWVAECARNDNRTVDLEKVADYVELDNFAWDGNDTVEFDFAPSPMYQHNNLYYKFTLENLTGRAVGEGQLAKAPNTFTAAYAYADTYVCTKCLGGGRYLIDNAYSMPQLISDGDLSTEGWSYNDKEGKTHQVSESQRSNLALVVTQPTGSVKNEVESTVDGLMNDISEGLEYKSATYEIDLQICGAIVSIPNGSYLKINLGYPDGLSYDNLEGVVFKLYHFKRDSKGNLDYAHPEEIECIFTPYGIMATVQSFSPYTLVTIRNAPEELIAQEAAKKGVTVQFDGVGGKLVASTGKLTDIIEEGKAITYTFVPDEGYEVEYALLNGKSLKVTENSLTLSYDMLAESNILSCGFVASSVKEAEKDSGSTNAMIISVANSQLAANGEETVEAIQLSVNGEESVIGDENAEMEEPIESAIGVVFNWKGHGADEEVAADGDGKVTVPTAPTVEGYIFGGWYDNEDCTGEAVDVENAVHTENKTYYAKWTIDGEYKPEIKVTFNWSGNGDDEEVTAGEDGKVSVPEIPTVEGYTFGGWYDNEDCTGEAVDVENEIHTESKTYYAKWTKDEEPAPEIKITFNWKGHGTDEEVTADGDGKVTVPTAPTVEGYTFGGWYGNEDCTGEAVDVATVAHSENKTYYAKWTKNEEPKPEIKVTFNWNGHGGTTTEVTADANGKVKVPEIPTVEGWKFVNWYSNQNCTGQPVNIEKIVHDKDTTYYASWSKNQSGTSEPDTTEIIITFNWNGHGGTTTQVTADENGKVKEPETPNVDGWTFEGWFRNADCSGNAVKVPSETHNANRTYYAKWKQNTQSSGGSGNTGTGNGGNSGSGNGDKAEEKDDATTFTVILISLSVVIVIELVIIAVVVASRKKKNM